MLSGWGLNQVHELYYVIVISRIGKHIFIVIGIHTSLQFSWVNRPPPFWDFVCYELMNSSLRNIWEIHHIYWVRWEASGLWPTSPLCALGHRATLGQQCLSCIVESDHPPESHGWGSGWIVSSESLAPETRSGLQRWRKTKGTPWSLKRSTKRERSPCIKAAGFSLYDTRFLNWSNHPKQDETGHTISIME